jgi:hypothetical protein
MPVLIGWCWFTAVVLSVSLVVHALTFLGIDLLETWPGLMLIHIAIFPPFFAAIIYANRTAGTQQGNIDPVVNSAPWWLRVLSVVFFVYGIANFAIFIVLTEGGGPSEREGKYVVMNHGTVIRELSEAEYHQHRAYVLRCASGHWMLFSCAALMLFVGVANLRRRTAREPPLADSDIQMLVGVANLRRRTAQAPAPTLAPPPGPAAAPAAQVGGTEQAGPEPEPELPPEPTSVRAGLVSLLLYVACLAAVCSGLPVLCVVAVPPLTIAMVLAMCRRRGFPHRPFESCLGCLTVFPNAFIASRLGGRVAEFIYLAIYVGTGAALSHEVEVTFPKEGPSQLSSGELLHNRVWAALMIFVMFPLTAVGAIGLTYLAEHVGRLIEVRRREPTAGPGP